MVLKAQIHASLSLRLPTLPPGLLLGTAAQPPRLLAYHATPPTPPGVPATRWATEHARLLASMCPGGIRVAARFVPTSPSTADAAADVARSVGAPLVVCVGSNGRLVAKEVVEGGTKSAEVRGRGEGGVVFVRGVAELEGTEEAIAEAVKRMLVRLKGGGEGVVVGAEDERLLNDVCGLGESRVVEVEVLMPIAEGLEEGPSMRGCMYVEAALPEECIVGDAVKALRADLLQSVRARMQLLHEGDEDDVDEEEGESSSARALRALPVRVVARPRDESRGEYLPMSEYLMEGESVENGFVNRFVEVLSWGEKEIAAYEIVQVEELAKVEPLTDVSSMKALDVASSAPMDYVMRTLIATVVVAIAAILVKLSAQS